MELIFIWIDDYHNIKNQGFSFSSEHEITFDKQANTLNVADNLSHIPGFFGETITNITAIVGKNGTGKSSLLDLQNIAFYLLKDDDSFTLVIFNEQYKSLVINGLDNCKIVLENGILFRNSLIIKYSPLFEPKENRVNHRPIAEEKRNGGSIDIWDISTSKRLEGNLFTNAIDTESQIYKYRLSEIFAQVEFLLSGFKLPYKTPEEVIVVFPLSSKMERFRKEINERQVSYNEEFKPYSGSSMDKEMSREQNENYRKFQKIEIAVLEGILENCLKNIRAINQKFEGADELTKAKLTKEMALSQLMWVAFFEFFNTYPTQGNRISVGDYDDFAEHYPTKPITEWFYDFFEQGLKKYILKAQPGKYDEEVKAWSKLTTMIREIEALLEKNDIEVYLKSNNFKSPMDIDFNRCALRLPLKDSSKFEAIKKPFVNIYKDILWARTIQSFGFLDFEWSGISSGERMFLSFFSRINSFRYTIKRENSDSKIKSIVLMIDEGEVGFHPDWQRLFITRLIETIPVIFQKTTVQKVQIILTTHSPFVLSDLPNHHVIFLDQDKHGNCEVVNKNPLQDKRMTFGANIHSLMADGFFMKDGLMGNFAKQKINDLIDDLIGSKVLTVKRKEEIRKLITFIGEPIIRKKVMDLYNEKMNLNVEAQINELQHQIDELKALQNYDSDKKR